MWLRDWLKMVPDGFGDGGHAEVWDLAVLPICSISPRGSSERLVKLFNNLYRLFVSARHRETPSTSTPSTLPLLFFASPLCLNYAKAVVRN